MDSAERLRAKLAEISSRQDQWLTLADNTDLPETVAYLAKTLILDDVSWLIGYIEAGEKFGA